MSAYLNGIKNAILSRATPFAILLAGRLASLIIAVLGVAVVFGWVDPKYHEWAAGHEEELKEYTTAGVILVTTILPSVVSLIPWRRSKKDPETAVKMVLFVASLSTVAITVATAMTGCSYRTPSMPSATDPVAANCVGGQCLPARQSY